MNLRLIPLALSLALAPAALAEFTVTLSNVHLCCSSCVKGVDKATATVGGAAAKSDRDADTVTITAPDKATAQKAVDALVAAGYFGTSSDPAIKVDPTTGAKDATVESLTITGLHLCCNKCVEAVNDVLEKVPGVKANTAVKSAASFDVTGSFNEKDVFNALQQAGLTGKAGKAQ
jgi:mercuric ion binding protein